MYRVTCSNCGKTENHKSLFTFPDRGWRSVGDALYCKKCIQTWPERNGDVPFTTMYETAKTIERVYGHDTPI